MNWDNETREQLALLEEHLSILIKERARMAAEISVLEFEIQQLRGALRRRSG